MPLLDHFNPPLSRTRKWRSFHTAWALNIAAHLNHGGLPPGYSAAPYSDDASPVEIDVAALREKLAEDNPAATADLGLWTPPAPDVSAVIQLPPFEDTEVQVFYDEGEPVLVAAIELVSPANKDRPAQRRAFATKCSRYLYRGCGCVVIDAVTTRRANLHAEIWRVLELNGGEPWHSPTDLYASAYRLAGAGEEKTLETWTQSLTLGGPLPQMPLWLGADICVALDLERSYLAACHDLLIPPAA
jgi:hypothetical protein